MRKISILTTTILFTSLSTFSQIEGKWKRNKTDDVVEIYKQNNLFFGKAVSSGNKTENEKVKSKNILVFSNFKKDGETKYCCGEIFLPRLKINVSGVISVLDNNTIEVKGWKSGIKASTIWVRL